MYCDECDITIPYTTDTCPLCNKKISDTKELDNPIYPRRNASFRFPVKYSFTIFFTTIAISIFLIVLIVNLLTDKSILWALIVGAGLMYTYALIRHTIMTSYCSASKIFIQGSLLCFLILIIQNVTRSGYWAYEYVIPMILVVNTAVLWAITLIIRTKRASYALTLIGVSILSFIPMIWFALAYSDVLWTALVPFILAIITLPLVLIMFNKILYIELKRLLHI